MGIKLDRKDNEILKILDSDFRIPISKVAKKVGLSKNSASLRFERLKELISHTTTGINNKMLGYTLIKVYYSMGSLDERFEDELTKEFKKCPNMLYIAKLYGHYNLEIAFFIQDIDELISQLTAFNKRFNKKINEKEIEILVNQYYFRNNFLYDTFTTKISKIFPTSKRVALTDVEKRILSVIRNDSRMSILDIAEKTGLNPKTVTTNMKSLEKRGIITGYYMSLDAAKLGLSSFKIFLQVDNSRDLEEFEKYITSLKDCKHVAKMLGLWDYEIDLVYNDVLELQAQIEVLRQKFPNIIKKIEIMNFGKRLITKKEMFLK
jgi:DNA-binding Lrp family transcriptional regulator